MKVKEKKKSEEKKKIQIEEIVKKEVLVAKGELQKEVLMEIVSRCTIWEKRFVEEIKVEVAEEDTTVELVDDKDDDKWDIDDMDINSGPTPSKLDLVFCVDSTGSMGCILLQLKKILKTLLQKLLQKKIVMCALL